MSFGSPRGQGSGRPSPVSQSGPYLIRLYVEGYSAGASAAIREVRSVCEEKLADCYQLEVIDVNQQPDFAKRDLVVAAPTLIKVRPAPPRKTVGELTRARILAGLDLE